MKKNYLIILIIAFLLPNFLMAQEDTTQVDDMLDMSLEDLMNIEVTIASKKAESIIEAPISTSAISAKEIENSGATSIPEVLRLLPGIIVREKTNGNYDVHIRGNDNPMQAITTSVNSNTLVMVDNRVVYSYFQGGVFWETLPVGISDIERIELIRGPSAALYGPNAVTGVINIITKKAKKDKLSANASVQAGSLNTKIAGASVGFAKEKFGIRVSGNYTYKERFQEDYYIYHEDFMNYQPRDLMWTFTENGRGGPQQIIEENEVMDRYPDINKGVEQWGINVSSFYNINEKVNFNLSSGIQKSEIQTIHLGQKISPMGNRVSNTKYINFQSDIYGLNTNIAYLSGQQNLLLGVKGFEFDTDVIEFTTDYNINLNNFIIRPGISYRNAMYNDLPYIDLTQLEGFIRSKTEINSFAPSLMLEYTLFEKLRFIGAIRMDIYNKPDDNYLAYEFASTYKINENNILRVIYSHANSGPFIYDYYMNFDVEIMPSVVMNLAGNDNLKLIQTDLYEFGFRSTINEKIFIDIELFYSTINNFSNMVQTETQTVQFGPNQHEFPQKLEKYNVNLNMAQTGVSFSLTYFPFSKLKLNTFGTFQKTLITDFDLNMFEYDNLTKNFIDFENNYTPNFYGGFSINYNPIEKLNIFTNLYFMSQQTYHERSEDSSLPNGVLDIEAKYIINLKASYKVWKNNKLFFNIRNITNNKTKEFIFADDTGIMYLFGLNINI